MARILVIGGAGYIGSHVVLAMLDAGHEVIVYDNLSTGKRENIFPNVEFVEGDIVDKEKLEEVFEKSGKIDAIIHMAALKSVPESMENPEKYSDNNIIGGVNILNTACKYGVKNILFSSSCTVYGDPEYIPVDEKHPINVINYYGFTKLEFEDMLKWYSKLKDINYGILRYFNAVGYDVDGRVKGLELGTRSLMTVLMEVALGKREKLEIRGDDWNTPDGTAIRDYIHVNDLAEAHLLALEYIMNKGESLLVNLGSENGLSVKEVLEKTREITGKEIPAVVVPKGEGEAEKVIGSSEKAKKLLGWEAKYSDADTIVRTTWNVYKNLEGKELDN